MGVQACWRARSYLFVFVTIKYNIHHIDVINKGKYNTI